MENKAQKQISHIIFKESVTYPCEIVCITEDLPLGVAKNFEEFAKIVNLHAEQGHKLEVNPA